MELQYLTLKTIWIDLPLLSNKGLNVRGEDMEVTASGALGETSASSESKRGGGCTSAREGENACEGHLVLA